MTKFLFILTFIGAVFYSPQFYAQKKKKNKTEERIKSEAKDDVLTLPNDRTPYKAKFYEALRLKTVGDYGSAVALFEECLKMNENDDAVLYVLAEFYAGNRQFTKAKNHITRAYQIDPKNIWYLELLGYIQQNLGLYEEAEISFKKLTDIEPFNMDWLYYYSEAQLFNGNFKEAIITFERLIEEAGPIPELLHRKIELLIDQGETDRVVSELKALIIEYPDIPEYTGMLMDYYQTNNLTKEAKSLLDELIAKDPNNPHLHLAMADYYNVLGDRGKTYFHLKNAFESDLLEIDAKVKLLIDIHDNQTPIDQEAFELVDILVEKHGGDAKTYSIQGDFYLKNKENEKALTSFRKALEYDKSKYPIWHEALILEYTTGQYELLYQDSKKALEYFPTISNLYLFAGLGALYTKRADEAIEFFTIGKDFVVKDNLLSAEFNFQLAEAYMAAIQYESAQVYYREALTLDPSNALYLNNYAYKLALHAVYLTDALDAIKKADKIAPNQPNFLDTYAWVLFQQKEYKQALAKIEQAYKLSPNSFVIAEHYGDILFKSGQEAKAMELWLTSRDLGNTDEVLEKKIQTKKYHERKP